MLETTILECTQSKRETIVIVSLVYFLTARKNDVMSSLLAWQIEKKPDTYTT